MAYLDRDPSVKSGRSHASSARSRPAPSSSGQPGGDMFSKAASGVFSMLKTSTDSGDIGDLSFNTSRLPSMPRPAHRRRTNVARLSVSSHHSNNSYTPSQMSKRNSNSQAWDAVSAISQGTHSRHAQQSSLTSLQTMQTQPSYAPENRAPPVQGNGKLSQYESRLTAPFSPDGRSYSLTQPQPSFALKPHRSATSLRSQASGPYPSQRNQYAYPARLKRPGYRGPSTALSDFGGPQYYNGYTPGLNDGHFFEPGFGHSQPYGSQITPSHRYNNGLTHRSPERGLVPHGHPQGPKIRNRPMPVYSNNYVDQNFYGLRPGQGRRAPPLVMPPYVGQHHMPLVRDTPAAESIPSASEQGSSPAPSSNPPTPKHGTLIRSAMEPVVVKSAFSDLRDERTEPHGFPNYLKYAERAEEICELDAVEPAATELPATPALANPGFVQRIKHLLEDRACAKPIISKSPVPQTIGMSSGSASEVPKENCEDHRPTDLPATRTSVTVEPIRSIKPGERVGTIEAVKLVELEAPPRLTRALIKANTAPSSSDQNTAVSQPSNVDVQPPRRSEETHIANVQDTEAGDETEGCSITIASSPPQQITDLPSVDTTVVSKDMSMTSEMDYAIRLDIPAPLRPDVTKSCRPESLDPVTYQVVELADVPVSPFHPGDEVLRDSMVSPLPTQTLQATKEHDHLRVPGSFPDEQAEPYSPQSRPVSDLLSVDTSTRFSIPPDLSLLNDLDNTSEVVTDVAVRFSIPCAADRNRPQLVSVEPITEEPVTSSGNTSSKQKDQSRSLRESFFRMERLSPLHIKKPETVSFSHTPTDPADLSSFIRRSFPRRQSVWPSDRVDGKRLLNDSTTETCCPPMKHPPDRLPGLKEDSQEDMSIKDYRSSGLRLGMIQAKVAYENLQRSEETVGGCQMSPRAPRMTLSELRNIPSLNFSRLDLIDKLNEALEVHSSKSAEVLRRRDFSGIYCPSPLRPSSTEALRERYTSFFDKLEDFHVPQLANIDTTNEDEMPTDPRKADTESEDLVLAQTPGVGDPEASSSFRRPVSSTNICIATSPMRAGSPLTRPFSRPLSPEELVNVCHEVNHLSVPSVSALAERLSDLLPSIKHLNLDSAIADDNAVRETLDEIHHLGHRPDSVDLLLRSSTGLRQLAAAADSIVTHGTHDSAAYDMKMTRVTKELPPLPEDAEKFSLSDFGLDRNTTLETEALSAQVPTGLEAAQSALLRVRSLNDIEEGDQMHPGFQGFPPSATTRSLAQNTHHSRPWNLDEYYPWTGKTLSIDINFPRPVVRRNTSASTALRRSRASDAASDSGEANLTQRGTTRARSPLAGQSSLFMEDSPTIAITAHSRKISKRSIIGSLSRRIGLGGNKTISSLHTSVLLELPGPTKPGDRYPSTALASHATFHLDEVRSFFSDSTSDGSDRRGSFRKHYKILRSRLPGGPITLSTSRLHSIDTERNISLGNHHRLSQTPCTMSLYDDRFKEPGITQNYEGMVGMGKVEFRVRRVTECLRHVILKTGAMFRTLSKRNPAQRRLQKERERAEWLDDSLYSGT